MKSQTLSNIPLFCSLLKPSFFTLNVLLSNSNFVGSACKWTSAPLSYASHANTCIKIIITGHVTRKLKKCPYLAKTIYRCHNLLVTIQREHLIAFLGLVGHILRKIALHKAFCYSTESSPYISEKKYFTTKVLYLFEFKNNYNSVWE